MGCLAVVHIAMRPSEACSCADNAGVFAYSPDVLSAGAVSCFISVVLIMQVKLAAISMRVPSWINR